jgi:hypothetical protein
MVGLSQFEFERSGIATGTRTGGVAQMTHHPAQKTKSN